jgi:hypothetical protein
MEPPTQLCTAGVVRRADNRVMCLPVCYTSNYYCIRLQFRAARQCAPFLFAGTFPAFATATVSGRGCDRGSPGDFESGHVTVAAPGPGAGSESPGGRRSAWAWRRGPR